MNGKLRAFDTWNAANIDDRHDLLIALAKDIWRTQPLVQTASA
jgi:hypothetical protein